MATKTFLLTVMLSPWVINISNINVTICMQCHDRHTTSSDLS